MKSKTHATAALLILTAALLLFSGMLLYAKKKGKEPDTGLPALRLSLANCTLDEIHAGATGIPYEGNTLLFNDLSFSDVTIKGRGNSSWKSPRKSYQLRFSEKQSLLGMNPAKKWLLIANYADASHMRNKLMYDLAAELMDYAPQSVFVDLWIDDEYRGNYLLCQKIAVSPSFVNLKSEQAILAEIDTFYWYDAECCFQSHYSPAVFTLKDSKADDLDREDSAAKAAFETFEQTIHQFEDLLYADEKDWSSIASMIDVDSFASFYLLEEFSENPDSCRTSLYLYQDGPDDVLHMGPVWDFDKALGYAQRGKYGGDPEQPYVHQIQEYMGTERDCTWYAELMTIPEFQNAVCTLYQTKAREVLASSGQRIDAYRQTIQVSAEYTEQFWPVSQIPEHCGHEPVVFSSWQESVDYLDDWIQRRLLYFDDTYGTGAG